MDVREYELLIGKLEAELTEAKQSAERKIRRDSLLKKQAMVASQIKSVEDIVTALEKLGREPSAIATQAVINLRKEAHVIRMELDELDDPAFLQEEDPRPGVVYPANTVDLKVKADVIALIPEMRATNLAAMSSDERRATFDIWSLRWRIVGEKIGQDKVSIDCDMRTGYAIIRTALNNYPDDCHHIPALKRECKGDWEDQLRLAKLRLQNTRDRELRYKATLEQFEQLKKLKLDPNDLEGARRFRHLVREIGRHPALRDDLAMVLTPYRAALGDEFAFLWKDDVEEEAPIQQKERMTNRELLQRLLRRMISKTLIGACHGPLDRVVTGFAEHDKGRAREIVNLLIKAEIIRAKKNEGAEWRISIEPAYVANCENFVKGEPFRYHLIDEWVKADEPQAVTA